MSLPLSIVVVGATGDLSQKKLLPALCQLFNKGLLPEQFCIVAFSRREWSDNDFRKFSRPNLVAAKSKKINEFLSRIHFHEGYFEDPESFSGLAVKLEGLDLIFGRSAQKLLYLAISPDSHEEVIRHLGNAFKKHHKAYRCRLLVEKPFGKSLTSAKRLEKTIRRFFFEKEIFRVDHYLGKEALMSFADLVKDNRRIFKKKWNRDSIRSISVSLREKQGMEGRGEFYDSTGAFLDVGQNHCLEMLATVLSNNDREMALKSLYQSGRLERGQYLGYTKEIGHASKTETYFKIGLKSRDPEWEGVHITLEGGKALKDDCSEILITFVDGMGSIRLQPDPSISLLFLPKKIRVKEDLDPYGHIFMAAIRGDHSHFPSLGEIYASWKIADAVSKKLKKAPLRIYKKGTFIKS